MQQKTINYNGKKIVYRTQGEGIPLVLVHGFGEHGEIWNNQLEAFANYHLIIPDLPGSGESEMVDDMSMEGMADVLEKIIVHELATIFFQAAEPGSVIMIGHSMGGYITLAFAERKAAMLRGFGLFHSTAFADSDEKKETRRKGIDFIKTHGAFEFLKTITPNLYAPDSKQKAPEKIQQHLDSARNFSGAALVNYYEAMIQRPDRTDILRNAKVPVLFIFGRHDTTAPLEDGLKQCYLPESSYVHILENSGHMGMVEQPTEANKHLLKYVNLISTS